MKKKKKEPIHVAFDTETFYRPGYSITDEGTRGYVEHDDFDCYLVTLANKEIKIALHPKEVEWEQFDGATFYCHNASFDQAVFLQMQVLGIVPDIKVNFVCTADMCAYFQLPRNLAGALKAMFDYEMPKAMRDWMKGKTWEDAVAEGKSEELLKYGIDDAIWCWKLVEALYHLWPENEKFLSQLTRAMGWEGLPMAEPKLREAVKSMEKGIWEVQRKLPWVGEIDPDTKKEYALYSKKGLSVYLNKLGLEPPKSLAKDSSDCDNWIKQHGTVCSYVADLQTYNRMTKHYKSLKRMLERTGENNRMSYGLKLYGATATHRWSGESGWNAQNMPRSAQFGQDIRGMICAPDGHQLIVSDSAQIEPRTIAKIVGDKAFLESCSAGISPYEAHARLSMGWTGGTLKNEDPEMYALAKTRVLGLGYGAGWKKFLDTIAAQGMLSILEGPYDFNDEKAFLSFLEYVTSQSHFIEVYENSTYNERRNMINAWLQVMDFRRKNPLIKQAWDAHAEAYNHVGGTGGDYDINLPSGRVMRFFRVRPELQGYSCTHAKGDKRRLREYGPSLFQKSVQATARDIFASQLCLLAKRGVKVVLHVHDEIVAEVKEDEVDKKSEIIRECMTTAPSWWPDIPLETSLEVTKTYLK